MTHPLERQGLYVPLDVNFADDPKVMSVGPIAELVYVRSLAVAKRIGSDGRIHHRHLMKLCWDLAELHPYDDYEDRIAARLVAVGLWIETADGWEIASWTRWNLTTDEIEDRKQGKAEGAALGNHRRWHEARNKVDANCSFCVSSLDRSVSESLDRSVSESTKTETETDKERSADASFASDFAAWWELYPRKVQRAAAFTAYKARRRGGTPHDLLVAALEHYALSVVGVEQRFVMHGSRFLGGKAGPWSEWADGPPEPVAATVKPAGWVPSEATRAVLGRGPDAQPVWDLDEHGNAVVPAC